MITFGPASLAKWQEGGVPDLFTDQFGDTWMGSLPGGLRLTGQFGGAANTFFYFGTTLLALWFTGQVQKDRTNEQEKSD